MKNLYSIEIDEFGLIISTSFPSTYFLEDEIPRIGNNFSEFWDESNNQKIKEFIENIFTGRDICEISFKTKKKSIYCFGSKHSKNKAFISLKYINLETESEQWGFDELPLEKRLVANQPITFYDNLKKFTENLPLVIFEIFLYPDGRFKFGFVNKEMENFFPLFNKEAINSDNSLLFLRVHPDDKQKLLDSIQDVFRLNIWDIEYRVIENGEIKWVRGYGRPESIAEGNYIKVCTYLQDITEKKKEAEQLKVVDFVFKNANVSIFMTKEDARFYDVNPNAHKLLGYSKEELMNKTLHEIDPNYPAEIWPIHWKELKTNRKAHFETQHKRKDGTLIDVDVNIRLIEFKDFDLNCAFVTDITEKKRVEENLRKSNERYEKATTATSDIVWECDFINKTIYFSKNFTLLFGHLVEEGLVPLEDNIWRRNIDPNDLKKIHENDQIEIKNNSDKWSQEYLLKKADGNYATILDRRIAIRDENGIAIGIIGSMQDITQKKKTEEEKEVLLHELTKNNNELIQFNYITTHNLRAPLTNLVSISNLIKTDTIEDELTKKFIEGFKTSTYHLNDTLNDLMKILIIKENPNLSTEALKFEDILEKVKATIEMKLLKERVIINSDFTKVPMVSFSSIYLESIFLNLMTNAIKYRHPDREPIITIKSSKTANGSTKLVFSDNGIGMNMERVKNKIFGLYQRFHNNSDSKGIGLYLVHSQITTMGGKISVDSEELKGTTFTINFK
ncbi:MAG: PAS domain S-box protein [Flavobacterium sp.]